MALQQLGDVDMAALLEAMESWVIDSPLVQRAAAAALCEPCLLRDVAHSARVLAVLDTITASIVQQRNQSVEAFQTLAKGWVTAGAPRLWRFPPWASGRWSAG